MGSCWLACHLYEQLALDEFWAERLRDSREGTCWQHILQTLVCYCVSPGVSPEWHEDKGGLRWFRALSAKGSWDRLKQEGLTDVTHLGEEHFKFSVLSNGLLKEFSLLGR